ncbi:molybdenum cofactor biosynthesis protein MoaE [Rhodoligotrophos defluvii]|uniref:molybdenum cofactor biosynthesis protein MoaE n=1 Tax=Rhodoligotrophos defluvii TaxID=2561934 RepID=UPI0010C94688|nr:molybdenum cofactor biosynthesis protein MoaE [Rhodoligotrophos defluvii]
MIRVQSEPFDAGAELAALKAGNTAIGGIALFVGTVRDTSSGEAVAEMTLEHYPGMTEKALADIEEEAHRRWPLEASLIVHRYGRLAAGDDIVLVITASAHREAAFSACAFLVDWLKTKAPFWKRERAPGSGGQERWVEAREADDEAAARWSAATSGDN